MENDVKFALPAQLPECVAELDELYEQVCRVVDVFRARFEAKQPFSESEVARLELLVAGLDVIKTEKVEAENISRRAIHEASHAVIAVAEGAQVASVELYPEGIVDGRWTTYGECVCASLDVAAEQRQHLIAAAGAVAEGVWEHGQGVMAGQIVLDGTDREVVQRWVRTAGAREESPVSAVLPLVRRVWPAIESLAGELVERGEVSHKHVVAALGLSNDHARHPFELANIRAGMRSVPVRP